MKEKAGFSKNTFKGNEYTEYGNILEPMIRDYINEEFRKSSPFKEGYFIGDLSPNETDKLKFRCNVDGINDSEILEIKTTSNIKSDIKDYKYYLVQLLFYMINAKKEKGMLAIYERTTFNIPKQIDKDKLKIYHIDLKDYQKLATEILESVDKFQEDLIALKNNPEMTDEDFINPIIVDNSKKVIALENKLKGLKEVEQELKKTKEDLFEAMKKYNVKKWKTSNGVTISRVDETTSQREVIDTKKLKADEPTIYNKYMEVKTSKRKGYVRIAIDENNVNQEFNKIKGEN
ncbi:hypothetical protein IV53_GL000676 [Ligilactobacillus ceti DSM 22408]|uniref:YqaJ viral recombinase domain-containing protein n=2 Tax=Ligilactobacillus TaxID=2767887 RepID=A0A0R2KMM2_9LACO|nr:hypothetical protein IV53_GL000676 [Ligilactobacillus ceti DSM 22408]